MRFPDEWIDLVKSSVDIVDVIGKTVQLRQTGRNYVGLCPPFHDEKTPSFTVNREKQFFHCFGCNTGGQCVQLHYGDPACFFSGSCKHACPRTGPCGTGPVRPG